MFGLQPEDEALALAPVSETSMAKWGVELTSAEEADLDRRAALQEELGPIDEIVDANLDRLGGVWLDQRSSSGDGLVIVVGFVHSVDGDLLKAILSASPAGTKLESRLVARSYADLQALADQGLKVTVNDPNVVGISIAPQDNAVVVRTVDGAMPSVLSGVEGYEVLEDKLLPVGCTSAYRCNTRPYRGGMEFQERFGTSGNFGWEECTSAFTVKRGNGGLALLTAAHCQIDYNDSGVYTLNSSNVLEDLGTWGGDTVPPRTIFCLTVCDMDVEVQLIHSLVLSLPANKNVILYSGTDKSHPITGASSYSNSWVGRSVCAIGIKMNLACSTITSIGTGNIDMAKEQYIARIHKGAYAYLANVPTGGDSGGPVLSGGTAYGTNTAVTENGSLFFSSVSEALVELSSQLCVTSGC
jgi:hypothetical protein